MGTRSFPGVKRPRRGFDHPPSSSSEVKKRVELYFYSPSGTSWPVTGWHILSVATSFGLKGFSSSKWFKIYKRICYSPFVKNCTYLAVMLGMSSPYWHSNKRPFHHIYFAKVTLPFLLTYLLTPWSTVLLEKLTASAASQEIPRIFGTRRFLTVLTSAQQPVLILT